MRVNRIWVLVFVPLALAVTEGPRCPPASAPGDCMMFGEASNEYYFNVKGKQIVINYGVKYLHITCRSDIQLDNKALPGFAFMTVVPSVTLNACAAPAAGFADALRALNVTISAALQLEDVPATPSLAAHHLRNINLVAFTLSAPVAPAPLLRPEASFLEPLRKLLDLTLSRVALSSDAALRLPVSLRALSLYDVGLSMLPAPVFARLPALVSLALRDPMLLQLDLSASPLLGSIDINAPLDGITLGPAVINATLQNARSVELRGNCSGLQRLHVRGEDVALPSAWLAKCRVRELRLAHLRPGALGADELWGANDLLLLEAQGCGLSSLPPNWIKNSTRLKILDLSDNNLESIPSEVVAASPALSEVYLSKNNLTAGAVGVLSAALLTSLALNYNPLGDLCDAHKDNTYITNPVSVLKESRALTKLYLRHTGATRVCLDWRRLPRLTLVDLQDNNITDLQYEDLQWVRTEPTTVDLRGNPLEHVEYSKKQYEYVRGLSPSLLPAPTELQIDSRFICDCVDYWFALALRERPRHGQAALRAVCQDGTALESVSLDRLLCVLPQKFCPERCKCEVGGDRSRVSCPDAGLVALPVAPELKPIAVLLLPRNNITRVDPASLAPALETLDLTDNLVTHIDAATVDELFANGRRVILDGNPLSCKCPDVALQRALAAQGTGGAAGERCRAAAEASCASALWALPTAALLLVAAAALAACLVRPSSRRRIKVFLFERGLCARWALGASTDPAVEAARDYDAFVSFSHHDAAYAAELAARLECGPAARRLCLHERDWTPGEWIPAQIASSVQRSRRTVALVSESFLASSWARAELREAYGAALREGSPRLLAVLLPGLEPPRAAAAPELAAYLAAVTYLRWDDPHFWDKLLLAVPPPPARPAGAVQPPQAPPPPPPARSDGIAQPPPPP